MRFSAKSRSGKTAVPQPPPHSIKSHGRFDLVVGPHVFSSTSLFEVHYIPQSTTTTTPYQPVIPTTYHPPTQPVAGPPTPTSVTGSALSSLSPGTAVTTDLVEHMTSAATSNPTLLKLLQAVAGGNATQSQKETLELLLRTFKSTPGGGTQPQPQSSISVMDFSTPTPTVPHAPEFDIVLEFNDKPGDRWIFPRGPVNVQPIQGHQGEDLIVNTVLPFPSTPNDTPGKYKEIVAFRFAGVLYSVHDLMNRWVGGHEKAVEYTRILNEIVSTYSLFTWSCTHNR